jgi:hypothetical protein
MASSIKVKQKKRGRGRPATGKNPIMAVRATSKLRAAIDDWAEHQQDKPKRSEAVRRLVELGLAAAANRKR